MLLAQVTVELGNYSGWGHSLLIFALAIACAYWFVLPFIQDLLSQALSNVTTPVKPIVNPAPNKPLKRRDVDRSSDTPPPTGFAAHLKIIEATAPNADAAVWWEYAKGEMTEAEVAIAEARLARKPAPEKSA